MPWHNISLHSAKFFEKVFLVTSQVITCSFLCHKQSSSGWIPWTFTVVPNSSSTPGWMLVLCSGYITAASEMYVWWLQAYITHRSVAAQVISSADNKRTFHLPSVPQWAQCFWGKQDKALTHSNNKIMAKLYLCNRGGMHIASAFPCAWMEAFTAPVGGAELCPSLALVHPCAQGPQMNRLSLLLLWNLALVN